MPASLYNSLKRELERLQAQGAERGRQSLATEPGGKGSKEQRSSTEHQVQSRCELRVPLQQPPSSPEERGTELAEARMALKQAQAALEEREQQVRELQGRLEAGGAQEEALREKAALLERCSRAEAVAEAMRCEMEAKTQSWRAGNAPEPGVPEQRMAELARQHGELTTQLGQLQEVLGRREAELESLREQLAARPVGRKEHEEVLARLQQAQREAKGQVSPEEHTRATAALQQQLQALQQRADRLQAVAEAKGREAARLQAELATAVPRGEHEAAQEGLRAEAAALSQRLNELSRRHEKTCEEVFKVQRQALFMKSERQAAEERLAAVQQQLAEARDETRRLQDLHGHVEDSARLVRDRDRKVGDGEVVEGWQRGHSNGEIPKEVGLSDTWFPITVHCADH